MAEPNAETEKPEKPAQRVLIVDDDSEIVESVGMPWNSVATRCWSPATAIRGWRWPSAKIPDLVILDMMMPKRSGFLVLEKLRRTRPVPLRVIMITANEGSRHKAYAEMLGVDDYIRKPFAMDRLMESVTGCWSRGQRVAGGRFSRSLPRLVTR